MIWVAFSAVILLVNDIDRPGEGFIYVDRQPLLDLQARLSPQQARHAASP
ncbi:MAG: hypothetical protein P8080_13905 [Gammaproteobacteria bacterium]